MSELVNVYTPSSCLRSSSDSRTLTIPCVRTKTFGQRSFAYQGPATWNELPFDLRHKDSLSTFKSALKTHLFSPSDLNCNKYFCIVVVVISICALCIRMIIDVIITCVFCLCMVFVQCIFRILVLLHMYVFSVYI